MSELVEHYRRQHAWRPWPRILPLLGDLRGETVLDLGCGVGGPAAELARLGAHVVGVERSEELVHAAREQEIPNARFLAEDILSPALDGLRVHGVWLAFSAAYFADPTPLLDRIERWLLPAGWVAITEVDDLFGHDPLAESDRALAEAYYARSFEEGLHDFRSRARLREALSARGFGLEVEKEFPDRELAFDGPAEPEVLASWSARLAGMQPRFVARFGPAAASFAPALLAALAAPDHRSRAKVWFLLARAPERQ